MDILIAAALTLVSIAMAYLGVHVTLHPLNESSPARFWYKAGFFVCGIAAVSLVTTQGTWERFCHEADWQEAYPESTRRAGKL